MLETTLENYGHGFFVKGEETGKKEGKKEGKREGKREGKKEGKSETLILLLEERFGGLSAKQKKLISDFNDNTFTQAFKILFSIKSVDEIFTLDN